MRISKVIVAAPPSLSHELSSLLTGHLVEAVSRERGPRGPIGS